MTAPAYYNFSDDAMKSSASATKWLSTTAAGQTIHGFNVAEQIMDDYDGSTLLGGDADDTYAVVSSDTKIVEAVNGGTDTVVAWCNFALPDNVENLTMGINHGVGQGNNSGNLLIAAGLGDTLSGGSGEDVFVDGGKGQDTFQFSPGGGDDVIQGFNVAGANHACRATARVRRHQLRPSPKRSHAGGL